MKETGVAERYAKALFLALEDSKGGSLAAVQKGLALAHHAIVSDPKLKGDLRNPLVPLERKKRALKEKAGLKSAAPELSNFLELLLAKKRMDLLPLILARFEQSVEESQGIIKASVKSASPLDAVAKREIEKKLAAVFGKKMRIETSVHPDLLAGLVIKAGDTVIDGSLKNKLKNLKASLTS